MVKITKAQLVDMAKSNDPNERKRALQLYNAWVKAAPKLHFQDRLSAIERSILLQIFDSKGITKEKGRP